MSDLTAGFTLLDPESIRSKFANEVAIRKCQFKLDANRLDSKLNRVKEEDYITAAVAKDLDAQREVQTPCGYIDIVSDTWNVIAEVKAVAGWKHALGQVLVYANYYPEMAPTLILFGEASEKRKALIRSHAERFMVSVIFIRGITEFSKNRLKLDANLSADFKHHVYLITEVLAVNNKWYAFKKASLYLNNDATA